MLEPRRRHPASMRTSWGPHEAVESGWRSDRCWSPPRRAQRRGEKRLGLAANCEGHIARHNDGYRPTAHSATLCAVMTVMEPIKLYWWRELPNFGDDLAARVVEHLTGRSVEHAECDKADMVGLGSILRMVAEMPSRADPIHVWGSGYLTGNQQLVAPSRIRVHALRGELTRRRLGWRAIALGDPGLLAASLLDTRPPQRHPVGIIGHHTHYPRPEWSRILARNPHALAIDGRRPALPVIRDIASCKVILSSSLHGLVVADSLGIPSCWVELSRSLCESDWKFIDYFSVLPRADPGPVFLRLDSDLEQLAEDVLRRYEPPEVARVVDEIVNAFPSLLAEC
jgi:pyruvyltransferase